MRGILIDPTAQTLAEITVSGKFDEFYKLMGCDCVDLVYVGSPGQRMVLVVDDEGLLKPGPRDFFLFANPGRGSAADKMVASSTVGPLAGKAILLGMCGPEGDFCDCPLHLYQASRMVFWPSAEDVRRFRDKGGFDTRITGFGQPDATIPVRPEVHGDADTSNTQQTEDK